MTRHRWRRRPKTRAGEVAARTASDRVEVARESTVDELGFERLIFFSDAVFAIAITLLVVDLRVPDLHGPAMAAQLHAGLVSLMPHILSFGFSFLMIGIFWVGHHRIFRYIRTFDDALLWINLVWLMTIVLVPFSTALLGAYPRVRLAVVVYAANMTAIGAIFLIFWWYVAYQAHLLKPGVSPRILRRTAIRLAVPTLISLLSIPLAFISPVVAELFWLLSLLSRPFIPRPSHE